MLIILALTACKKVENFDNSSGRNKYIIITSMQNYENARDNLLESLSPQFPLSNIILVFSGEPTNIIKVDPDTNMKLISLKRNIYEYSAFLVPAMLDHFKDTDMFLLLHDTCFAGTSFAAKYDKMCDEFYNRDVDILWCSPHGQCNICIFNKKTSVCATKLWENMFTLDKMDAISMEHDKENPLSLKSQQSLEQYYTELPNHHLGEKRVYSNTLRHVLHYTSLDIEKYYVDINKTSEHPQQP